MKFLEQNVYQEEKGGSLYVLHLKRQEQRVCITEEGYTSYDSRDNGDSQKRNGIMNGYVMNMQEIKQSNSDRGGYILVFTLWDVIDNK